MNPFSDIDVPEGGFACIFADPPWSFKQHDGRELVPQRAWEQHYKTMKPEQLRALPVSEVAAKDCVLIMWTTSSNLVECIELARAWGFEFKSIGMIWVKTSTAPLTGYMRHIIEPVLRKGFQVVKPLMSMGFWFRQQAEITLVFTRGKPKRIDMGVGQVFFAPRREHSRKPDEAYARVERLCAGPRLDMFGRQGRPGWTVWGDQKDRFNG